MILFRLADLPRTTWRLSRPVPLLAPGEEAGATVGWGLRPALLDPADGATLGRVAGVIAAYAEAEGQLRSSLDAGEQAREDAVGDYRLARCLARCVEEWYTFDAPETGLAMAPRELRALVYRYAQEQHGGFVPSAARAGFLATVAREAGCTASALEHGLQADTVGRALLHPVAHGAVPLSPGQVVRRYNAAAVATVLAAASFVVLRLELADTSLLKGLYRRARGLHTGVDLSLGAGGAHVEATLYGPGSRALVRLREVSLGYDLEDGQEPDAEEPALLPAAGGPSLPIVLAGLSEGASGLTGWARMLGPDRRPYHYPIDRAALAALRGETALLSAEDGQVVASYDSAVEADFAAAFLAQQAGGRMGLTRGWTLAREPRPVIVGGTVFLPDFGFRRGEVEVLCEIVGYYTEDYLLRKRRKLAALRGQLSLLLVVDQALAGHLGESGFPTITYKAGQVIRVTEVVAALDRAFDPFARRRDAGLATLRALCTQDGPPTSEEQLCVATGCAGRTELAALWQDLIAAPSERPARHYVAGQGLISTDATARAAATLRERLTAAGGCLPLDEGLALCRLAGLGEPDETLLTSLGLEVRRQELFGNALVCLPGSAERASDAQPRPGKRRKR